MQGVEENLWEVKIDAHGDKGSCCIHEWLGGFKKMNTQKVRKGSQKLKYNIQSEETGLEDKVNKIIH